MLGTPTQAFRHYNIFSDEFMDSLSGIDRMILDMECLSEYNRREKEAYEKDRKDSSFKGAHPGAENYPDRETMWQKAIQATKKVKENED